MKGYFQMKGYLLKRLFLFIPTLLGITWITFLLMKAIPGDPALGMVGERAPLAAVERIREQLGSHRPLLIQYLGYLKLISQGEWGRSYYTQRKVAKELKEKFPHTLRLALAAMFFATLVGIFLGVLMAVKYATFWDRLGLIFSLGGISLPVFWLGLILMLIFAFYFHLLPPSGMGQGNLLYLVLPASTLGINSAAYISRITRSSLLEVLSQPYISTARAKGLKEWVVIGKHAFKNALIPIITLVGLDFGSYLNGSVLTETIFGWDGIGRYALEGIIKRDYPVIMGTVLLGAIVFLILNLLVDISYALFDPKIRLQEKGK